MQGLYIGGVRFKGGPLPESYEFRLPAVRALDGLQFTRNVTFFVGENGTGKSTLLEAIAVAYGFNAEGGSRNYRFSTYSSHSALCGHLLLVKGTRLPKDGFFLRAESFYNVASYIEQLDEIPAAAPPLKASYGGKSLHNQSHGESFLALALNRFGGEGVYILDEPEAALSVSRQLSLLARIHQLAAQGSQFLIATHSPILLACPEAEILVLGEGGLRSTPYRETEPYTITKQFLDCPGRMLEVLLRE